MHCLKRISSPSKWTIWGTFLLGDAMVTPTGTDWKPAEDYSMEAVHCSCRTTCNTRHCHRKNKDLIATLPVQTPDVYHVSMWRLILNKDLGWCCFTQAVSLLFTSEYGKILYSSSRNNGKFNLLLSYKGSKYHVSRGRMGLEILYGFCGPAKYTAAMYAPR